MPRQLISSPERKKTKKSQHFWQGYASKVITHEREGGEGIIIKYGMGKI